MSGEDPIRVVGAFVGDLGPQFDEAPQKVPMRVPVGHDGEDDHSAARKGHGLTKSGRQRGVRGQRGRGAKQAEGASYDYSKDPFGAVNQNHMPDFGYGSSGSMFPPSQFGGEPQMSMPPYGFPAGMHPGQMMQTPWGMMPPPMPMSGWGPQFQSPPGYPIPMGAMPGMPAGIVPEVPKGANGHTRTTAMLRNLPSEYTRDMVISLLNAEGFERLYDFVYMPMNLRTMSSFGYVFVNFVSPVVADQCRSVFQGLTRWEFESDKVCDVLWSAEQQGLGANIERYRNSPVVHEIVPDECKPVVFANGVQVPFPAPTKRLREPRIRRPQAAAAGAEGETAAAEG